MKTDKYVQVLNDLMLEVINIPANWNGDESGEGEDHANLANDIIGTTEHLKALLEDIDD